MPLEKIEALEAALKEAGTVQGYWVAVQAVKELKPTYYNEETLLSTIYP